MSELETDPTDENDTSEQFTAVKFSESATTSELKSSAAETSAERHSFASDILGTRDIEKRDRELSKDFEDGIATSEEFSFHDLGTTDEEEHVVTIVKETKPKENLLPYLDQYDRLTAELNKETANNNFLHRKIIEHFIRHKKMHMLFETKVSVDKQKKYEKELDKLGALLDVEQAEEETQTKKLAGLKKHKLRLQDETDALQQKFYGAEQEVAKEILSHESPDTAYRQKVIELCFKRQRNHAANLSKIRLDYVKLQNRMSEVIDALNALDNLGPNLFLVDYEQLRINNRNLRDKSEENENDLIKIRERCQTTTQTLAHIRAYESSIDENIDLLQEQLETLNRDHEGIRGTLNIIVTDRDRFRSGVNKLKSKSGLITHPILLQDMQKTLDEVSVLSKTIEDYKRKFRNYTRRVETMRRVMKSPETLRKFIEKKEKEKKKRLEKDDSGRQRAALFDSDFSFSDIG